MAISYEGAICIIKAEATASSHTFQESTETIQLYKALNRISKSTHLSPLSTPKWDTSAMDGYALSSKATQWASEQNPVAFAVKATIAAGDEPPAISGAPENGIYPCVEIMTGARFPPTVGGELPFDCCVRVEDTVLATASSITKGSSTREKAGNFIHVGKPARPNQHKRLAGEDFERGDMIIEGGSIIRPPHVMALASVGIETLTVLRKPRVAVFSTGSELIKAGDKSPPKFSSTTASGGIPDVNGPYISATLEEQGCDVDFLEVIEDNSEIAAKKVISHLQQGRWQYDMLITTGGVSVGKFDFIREAMERLNASILFHRVAMRPGHPALFATIPYTSGSWASGSCNGNVTGTPILPPFTSPSEHVNNKKEEKNVAFFGLPGNPIASAACLQFLVMPFLRTLVSKPCDLPIPAIVRPLEKYHQHANGDKKNGVRQGDRAGGLDLASGISTNRKVVASFPSDKDVFRAGKVLSKGGHGIMEVSITTDHSPGKVSPFLGADCWVHVHQGCAELREGDYVDLYPLMSGRAI
ncbi:hypothetical protein EMCG_06425 [[Emmonsia] crescens]|uniref:molybdopterin adenylyltransferase n=1 Tax=[Emmonsia] crescens TaxID=73230 RepID=A0A0G2JBQ6_9EURO|nr:hypothetical protein EMCG_06425 [Emmonsia crescens UAMH 3008]